jgi:hypothetical protein
VVQCDLGKETAIGFPRKGFLEPPPKEWRNAIVEIKADYRVRNYMIVEYLSKIVRRYSTYNWKSISIRVLRRISSSNPAIYT